MRKLPFDQLEKYKEILNNIQNINFLDSSEILHTKNIEYDIEFLSKCKNVYFISNSPSFEFDNKPYFCETFFYSEKSFLNQLNHEFQNNKLFCFYTLSKDRIRGLFIDASQYIAEDRDTQIDKIIN